MKSKFYLLATLVCFIGSLLLLKVTALGLVPLLTAVVSFLAMLVIVYNLLSESAAEPGEGEPEDDAQHNSFDSHHSSRH